MEFWEAVTVLHLWLSIPLKTRFKKKKKNPTQKHQISKKTRQAKVGVKERDPRGSDSRGVESI